MKFYNAIVRWLLRSPLHGLLSKSTMLITVSGRRSGKLYTVPVNYVREGGTLTVSSLRDRTWWKNVRGGATVAVRVQGQGLTGTADVLEDDEAVAAGLLDLLRANPRYASYYKVTLTPDGQPTNPEQIARLTQDRVIVRVRLSR